MKGYTLTCDNCNHWFLSKEALPNPHECKKCKKIEKRSLKDIKFEKALQELKTIINDENKKHKQRLIKYKNQTREKNKLYYYRKINNLTQIDLADALGISRRTINRIENGEQNIKNGLASLICELFNIKLEDIFPSSIISGE